MTPTQWEEVFTFEAEYACFNQKRTLGTATFSQPRSERVSGGILLQDPEVPERTYVNRVILLQPDHFDWQQLTRFRKKPRIDVIHPHSDSLSSRLSEEMGYQNTDQLVILKSLPKGLGAAGSPIQVQRFLPAQSLDYLKVIATIMGMEIDPQIIASKQHLYCTDSFRCYVAFLQNQVAGIATLFISGQSGWLANAFTFPEFRRQGVQSALIKARLDEAHRLGLTKLYTDVQLNSDSMRNLNRLGFEEIAQVSCWESEV